MLSSSIFKLYLNAFINSFHSKIGVEKTIWKFVYSLYLLFICYGFSNNLLAVVFSIQFYLEVDLFENERKNLIDFQEFLMKIIDV